MLYFLGSKVNFINWLVQDIIPNPYKWNSKFPTESDFGSSNNYSIECFD